MKRTNVILIIVGILLYLPSLFGGFVWDDEDFVFANQYVANFQIDKFFTESVTAGRGKLSNYFRPIQQIAYSSTHAIFGFNPFWFHLVSVLFHLGASLTVYYFLILLTKSKWPSFFVALIFLIHPVQTETVSYISGVSDSIYVLFGFACLIAFLKSKKILSLIFFTLCLLSKETGIVFLPIIFILVVLNLSRINTGSRATRFQDLNIKEIIITILPFATIAILYLSYHFTNINQMNMHAVWGADSVYANSVLIRLSTFIQNLPTYFGLLIFPKDLFMERDYTIQIATNWLPQFFLFVFLNGGFIFTLFKLIKKQSDLVGLLFFYFSFWISLIPYSGLVLINGIFYEHFLYLPIVWFYGFVVYALAIFVTKYKTTLSKNIVPAIVCLIIVFGLLILRNITRQFDWNDSERFYRQTLLHAPKSLRISNGLAITLAQQGKFNEAILQYEKTIALDPRVPNPYHNLANVYLAKGDIDSAEKYYLKALEVDPKFEYSAVSLVNLYSQTNQKEKLDSFLKKIKIQRVNGQ